MNEEIPLIPGLTEIRPAPDSLECWHPQDRPHPVPIANMTTVHLMHCTVWIERHKEPLRMREEAQLFEFLMRHGGDMSETNAWHFDSEMGRVAQQTPDEWWPVMGELVIDLTENEWAIRPLAIMRGLAA